LIVVVASRNENKIREIRNKYSKLEDMEFLGIGDFPGCPEVDETGSTFSENALLKAREICSFTGEISLADDSGLVVDALNGEPGVFSARFGGEGLSDHDRTDLLLERMSSVPAGGRSARFKCSIAIVHPDGREYSTEGICEGLISFEKKGTKGFGYDPVFVVNGTELTMAEMDMDQKNRISHRAEALKKAESILKELLYGNRN